MKIVHSIGLASEKRISGTVTATRTSTTRRYTACLVATTTERSLEIAAAKKVALETAIVTAEANLATALAKYPGMTIEAAEAEHTATSERWYAREDGYFATSDRIRKEREAKGESTWVREGEVKADLLARGIKEPFDKNTSYAICAAASELKVARNKLEWHVERMPKLGSQGVISWHATPALAQKALGGREAQHIAKLGDKIEIRTDITIVEKPGRAAKEV